MSVVEPIGASKGQRASRAGQPYTTSAVWFRARREALALTQEQLAAAADVSQSLISQLEDGKHPPTLVRFDRLSRILNALRATMADMLEHTALERNFWPNLGSLEGPGYNTRRIPVYEDDPNDDFPIDREVGQVDIPSKWSGEYLAYRVRKGNVRSSPLPISALVIVRRSERYRLGDKVLAWVPGRGMVTKILAVDSEEKAEHYAAGNYAALVEPGAVLMGLVRETRIHSENDNW